MSRTGQVFLEDFDIGMATTLGAQLIDYELDGEIAQVYAVAIEGVTGPDSYQGLVPVAMGEPEDTYSEHLLPQIVISRGDITPDLARWHPGGREYQVPAGSAESVPGPGGQLMPSHVEKKWWTVPYEITYDIHLRSKLRAPADAMFLHVGTFFWPRGQVWLRDSVGDERGYYAFQESVGNLSELADVADRLQGHTISLRVEAELDFNRPFVQQTAQRVVTRLERK